MAPLGDLPGGATSCAGLAGVVEDHLAERVAGEKPFERRPCVSEAVHRIDDRSDVLLGHQREKARELVSPMVEPTISCWRKKTRRRSTWAR